MGLFGSRGSSASAGAEGARAPRHSSGWAQLAKHLKDQESLRILDIGPTSAGNINFVTGLGHSIYMANLVEEAARPEYAKAPGQEEGGEPQYDVARFLSEHLRPSGRNFDVVALWDTVDYLPGALAQPLIDRIFDLMEPGGKLLAFFHSKATGPETTFSRCHLGDTDQLQVQAMGKHPLLHTYSNRQVETMFQRFGSHKFFMAKDALRETIVTR